MKRNATATATTQVVSESMTAGSLFIPFFSKNSAYMFRNHAIAALAMNGIATSITFTRNRIRSPAKTQ